MAAKKISKKPQSKSSFIRKQPASLSAAEVVAKAKAAGIKLTSQLVYKVRGDSKAKKKGNAKKTSKTKPVASKGAASKSPAKMSKADFVRSRSHLSPKEIVEDAKAAGIKLDASYVYNVRGYDAAKKRVTKQAARATTPRKGAGVPRPVVTVSKAEDLLKAVAAEIGLGRAMEILEAERARVRAVIGAD
jgi:D-alanyl-D-alanine endopeptidase (penicillin-binding protein 7)